MKRMTIRSIPKPAYPWAGLALFAALMAPAQAAAAEPQNAPLSRPGIEVLRASDLGTPQSHLSGSAQGENIRRRDDYGEGYRYGRSVNGPNGDIIIWSPKTGTGYGAQPRPRFGTRQNGQRVTQPPTGPRLEYKPDYGDPPSRRD